VLTLAKSFISGLTIYRSIVLGVLAALSVATKDQVYGALVFGLGFLVIVHIRRTAAEGVSLRERLIAPTTLMLTGIAVYLLAAGVLISPDRFSRHLHFLLNYHEVVPIFVRPDGEVQHALGGNVLRPNTLLGYTWLAGDVLDALIEALGPIVLCVAAAGVLVTWRSGSFAHALAIMAVGFVVLSILPVRHMQFRYVFLLAFVVAFYFARTVVVGMRSRGLVRALTLTTTVLALGWLGARGVDLTYQMVFDARVAAGNCLARYLQPGDQLGFFGAVNQLPLLPEGVTPVGLPDDWSAIAALERHSPRFVIVGRDLWSEASMDRSWSLAPEVYERLKDGALGYQRLGVFETAPLLGGPVKYLPIINPGIRVFGDDRDAFAMAGRGC
jgi:hypothetical protein